MHAGAPVEARPRRGRGGLTYLAELGISAGRMQGGVGKISKELTAASTRPLILAVLSRGESYGYAIIREVRERSGGVLAWSEGMLYPVLHRLEQEGVLRSRWDRSESGRRRKYYRITDEGVAALRAERSQWTAVHDTLNDLWGAEPCRT